MHSPYTQVTTVDAGGLAFSQTLVVDVLDVNDAPGPPTLSVSSLSESTESGVGFGVLSATDEDAGQVVTSFTLVAASVEGMFAIVANTLIFAGATGSLDFEKTREYSITVVATDPEGLTSQATFTISITDANDAPISLALSSSNVAENSPVGAQVGLLTVVDPDAQDNLTFALSQPSAVFRLGNIACTSPPAGSFGVVCSIPLLTDMVLNYEAARTHIVDVTVTDKGGLSLSQRFVVQVDNVNDAPTNLQVSPRLVQEGLANTRIGSVVVSDEDSGQGYTCTIAGDNRGPFAIQNNVLQVGGIPLDYEAQQSHDIAIVCVDTGTPPLSISATVAIAVLDVNEAPTAVLLTPQSIEENAADGTVVGTLSTIDEDTGDTHSYALVDSAGGRFRVEGNKVMANGNGGSAARLDFEDSAHHIIKVISLDSGALSVESNILIEVVDANDAPAPPVLSRNTLPEDSVAGTLIGVLSASDQDAGQAIAFTLVGYGSPSPLFAIRDGHRLVFVGAPGTINHETIASYPLTVRGTDPFGAYAETNVSVLVTDVNELPYGIELLLPHAVSENARIGSVPFTVSALEADYDQVLTFAIFPASAFFRVRNPVATCSPMHGRSGAQTVCTASIEVVGALDHEQQASVQLTIAVSDGVGPSVTQTFTVHIDDVNEAPTNLAVSGLRMDENAPEGTLVGTITVTEVDVGQHVVCTLADSLGGRFAVDTANNLRAGVTPTNYEDQTSHRLHITCADSGSPPLSIAGEFVVTVEDINEAPRNILPTVAAVEENSFVGVRVAEFRAEDPDRDQVVFFSLDDDSQGRFVVLQGVLLLNTPLLDFEQEETITIVVRATDNGVPARFSTQAVIITVIDVIDCTPGRCLNGGECLNQPGGFLCVCAPGFEGLFCESDIDECAMHPCRNGGICLDQVNRFACDCAGTGFSGPACSTPNSCGPPRSLAHATPTPTTAVRFGEFVA